MATQLFTLLGVLLGAASSYLAGTASERGRHRRDLDQRWSERKLDAYVSYLSNIKEMRGIARRMLRDTGLDDNLPIPVSKEEGLPLLAEAEAQRSVSAELVLLIGTKEVINALHDLNRAVWKIERFARGLVENPDSEEWQRTTRDYSEAMNKFQECARQDVGILGGYVPRGERLQPLDEKPAPPAE